MSIFGKCDRCGWEKPSGNHFHTSDACNDIRDDKLLRVARAVSAEPIVIAGQLGQFKTIVYTDELHEALEEVKDIL